MAVGEGEDLQELANRMRGKKEWWATNKLIKESEMLGRGTSTSETDAHGREAREGKAKMADYETPTAAGKRKHGMKLMSVTPLTNGEDEEDRDSVHGHLYCL